MNLEIDILRNQFVAARLRERERLFLNADLIDQLLAEERLAECPNRDLWACIAKCPWDGAHCKAPEWSEAARSIVNGMALSDIFRVCGRPLSTELLPDILYEDCPSAVNNLVAFLTRSFPLRSVVYQAGFGYCVVTGKDTAIGVSSEGFIATLTDAAVLAVAYAAWVEHEDGPLDEIASAARDFLCNWLEWAVRLMREKAMADFAGAFAISAKGTKILSASPRNFVFVYSDDDFAGAFYPASAFLRKKILLPKSVHSNSKLYGDISLADFLNLCASTFEKGQNVRLMTDLMKQRYPLHISLHDGSVLFIDPADCPDPLPTGGEMRRAQ